MKKENPLAACVREAVEQYFIDLNGETAGNLHAFFICQVERPFIESVMKQTGWNQSEAAKILGINRNTLRKKLKLYNLN